MDSRHEKSVHEPVYQGGRRTTCPDDDEHSLEYPDDLGGSKIAAALDVEDADVIDVAFETDHCCKIMRQLEVMAAENYPHQIMSTAVSDYSGDVKKSNNKTAAAVDCCCYY